MNVHFMSKTDEWETPIETFLKLHTEFNFTVDVCATPKNRKLGKYYTREEDGLSKDWGGEFVWMNPPYGRTIGKWVEKLSQNKGVGLLPARTDTKWFHDFIYGKAEIRFLKGRLKFGGGKNSAPFPSMVVVFK